MLLEDLNKIEFSEDELNEYIELGNIENSKLEQLELKVEYKLSRKCMMEVKEKAESMLQADEKFEAIIKGGDVDELASIMISPHLTSDDYATHKIIFITNKRILISFVNHYNKGLKVKTYNRNDLIDIKYGKKVFHKMSSAEKKNFIVGIFSGGVLSIIELFDRPKVLFLYPIFIIAYYWLIKITHSYAVNIILEFEDGYTYELVAHQKSVKRLKEFL